MSLKLCAVVFILLSNLKENANKMTLKYVADSVGSAFW